jgi:hypothetical protein
VLLAFQDAAAGAGRLRRGIDSLDRRLGDFLSHCALLVFGATLDHEHLGISKPTGKAQHGLQAGSAKGNGLTYANLGFSIGVVVEPAGLRPLTGHSLGLDFKVDPGVLPGSEFIGDEKLWRWAGCLGDSPTRRPDAAGGARQRLERRWSAPYMRICASSYVHQNRPTIVAPSSHLFRC